jgi:hypothetical protein
MAAYEFFPENGNIVDGNHNTNKCGWRGRHNRNTGGVMVWSAPAVPAFFFSSGFQNGRSAAEGMAVGN